jgi:hypothetical protein
VNEAVLGLRPQGLILIAASSELCPVRQEFNLPMYSWYPGVLKEYIEKRAVTDWPSVANCAKYSAVHCFTFFQLRSHVGARGCEAWDRLSIAGTNDKSALRKTALTLLRSITPLRLLGHIFTTYTLAVAPKAG